MKKEQSQNTGYFHTEDDGTRYFIHGNTKIKVVEHFAAKGKTFREIMMDLICKKVEQEELA